MKSPSKCMRCGDSLKNGFTMSMLNTDYICPECKNVERQSRFYNKAAQAEREAYTKGIKNFRGLYSGVKPTITINSLNAKEYTKRILNTYNYIVNKFQNSNNFGAYLTKEYNMDIPKFTKEALNNSEKFRTVCMRLAGESVGQKMTACHSYAGSVCAVMCLLNIPCKVYTGLALKRDNARYRLEKVESICNDRPMCNHCWVYCLANKHTYDYFNGYNQNIDYIAWMEVS